MLWVFPTASKYAPVRIICFIIKALKNEQQPNKRVIIDEDGTFENSTYITNLLVDEFSIYMKSTGGDASWLNEKNEIHNIRINNMVRAGLMDSNQYESK